MFWSKGPGRFLRIGAWSAFFACFAFGRYLAWYYGEPCPGISAEGLTGPTLICGPPEIGRLGNENTLAGIAFLCLAIYCTTAHRAERRRRKAQDERMAKAKADTLGRIRVSTRRRAQDHASRP